MTECTGWPLFSLRGQVALITGATGGLGQAIACAYAQHGADVILADREEGPLREVVDQCRDLGAQAQSLAADLADSLQANALGARAQAVFGRVDTLVCNAGIQGPAGSLLDVKEADWARVFQVNLASAHALCSSLIPGMADRGCGSVVLMASIAGLRGNRSIGLYGLSKAALAQLARNLAVEWGPKGVRVNAIAPGLIRTPLASGVIGDDLFMTRRLALTPLRRVGEPHEVAGVAVMLAAAAGAYINGQTLVVDGGTTITD